MELIAALIGAIVGSFASALLTSFYMRQEQRKQIQIQTTMNLYNEFQSKNMLASRIKADKLLDENRSSERPLSFMGLHKELDEENWHHLTLIVHFWEKFSVLYQSNYLDNKLARTFLGRYFDYYFSRYFKALGRESLEKDESLQSGWAIPINNVAEKIMSTNN